MGFVPSSVLDRYLSSWLDGCQYALYLLCVVAGSPLLWLQGASESVFAAGAGLLWANDSKSVAVHAVME